MIMGKMRLCFKALWLSMLIVVMSACSFSKTEYVTDPLKVECNWDTVNLNLEQADFESVGLHIPLDYKEIEASINAVYITNFSEAAKLSDTAMRIELSYGATLSNTYEDSIKNGDQYFTSPMIQVLIWLPNNHDAYTAKYDVGGQLVSESGNYFIDGGESVQKFFCQTRAYYLINALGL